MRRVLGGLVLLAGMGTIPSASGDDAVAPRPPYFAAPGYYGMAFGFPSYGSPRLYSAFASPYGPGYGYGYPPATILPGPHGLGLWRAGRLSRGEVYGTSRYRAFPAPYPTWGPAPGPAVGYYAPGFGPPAFHER